MKHVLKKMVDAGMLEVIKGQIVFQASDKILFMLNISITSVWPIIIGFRTSIIKSQAEINSIYLIFGTAVRKYIIARY